jgi:hypothetical protein
MAAGMIIDRGWGKAAQVLAIDGELRQLVEVKLNVVQPKSLDNTTTKLLTNPEKSNEINAGDLSAIRSTLTSRATLSNSRGGFGSFLGPGAGEGLAGDPVKTTRREDPLLAIVRFFCLAARR